MTYYKVLRPDGSGRYSGKAWPLPTDDIPGEWLEVSGQLVMCHNGLHVTDWQGVWQHWIHQSGVVYEAEIGDEVIGDIGLGDRKLCARRARLLRRVPDDQLPDWWRETQAFIGSIPSISWLQPDGNPDPEWRVYPTRITARDAARDAAGDAALMASVLTCAGINIDQRHIDHARARMRVWQKGYGLYGDVNGVLYVYERIA